MTISYTLPARNGDAAQRVSMWVSRDRIAFHKRRLREQGATNIKVAS